MSELTIDLLSIPIYQQMARVIYFDRCMVKWAGMLLSEHNEQMKDQEGQSDAQPDNSTIIRILRVLSIIIPTLNEQETIVPSLTALQPLRHG